MTKPLLYRLALVAGLLLPGSAGRAQQLARGVPADTLRAQPANLAAHARQVQALPPDSNKVRALSMLSIETISTDNVAAVAYGQQALALARRLRYRTGIVRCLGNLGEAAMAANDQVLATQCYQQALALLDPNRPLEVLLLVNNQIGLANVYALQGNYAGAESYYQQAAARLAHPTTKRLQAAQLALYNSMGNFYGLWQESGHAPARLKPLATRYLRLAVAGCRQLGDAECVAGNLIGLGQALKSEGRLDSATHCLRQGLALGRQIGSPQIQYMALDKLANTGYAQGRWAEAATLARQALPLVRQVGNPTNEATIQEVLGKALAKTGDGLGAYAAAQASQRLRDTVETAERTRTLARLQVSFKAREQQARIQALEQDRRLAAQAQELARLRQQRQLAGGSVLLLLTLAGAGGLVWQYRRRQTGREAALRQRLAADLHDDVGSLLTQINMQSDLLRQPNASPAATLARLDRLGEASRQAARQMADVVWGLQETSTSLPEVLTHMRDHAHEVLPPAGLVVDFGVSPAVEALQPPAAVCQHLYLIYKECLHNVVKHARGATQVTVRLSHQADQLCLTVQDNAPGPAPVGRAGGHGLANMQRRAEAVGGTVRVEAGAEGFGVRAFLPV